MGGSLTPRVPFGYTIIFVKTFSSYAERMTLHSEARVYLCITSLWKK